MTDLAPRRLEDLETVIERGLATFVEVGQALMEIRDANLYRSSHPTFEEYCRDRWQMERAHAYRLIQSADVAAVLSPTGDNPLPRNEAQTRELAPLLADPKVLREVWAEVVDLHPKPTAEHVREAVAQRLPGPKAAQKLAKETGRVVPATDGRLYIPQEEAHPWHQAIVEWAGDLERMPAPTALTVPSYVTNFDAAAERVHAYLSQVIAHRKENAA